MMETPPEGSPYRAPAENEQPKTLPEKLKGWTWNTVVYRDAEYRWEWIDNQGLMSLPDRCAAKMEVGRGTAGVKVFNRTMPGVIDFKVFDGQDYGAFVERPSGRYLCEPPVHLSKFRLDDFCADIEKYIRFFLPPYASL